MNRRVGIVLATLVAAGIFTCVQGTFSQPIPQTTRKAIDLPGKTVQARSVTPSLRQHAVSGRANRARSENWPSARQN